MRLMASNIADLASSIVGGEEFHSARSSGFFEEGSKGTMLTQSKLSNLHDLGLSSSSSIVILDDQSQFSRDIDRWMNGEAEGAAVTQRSHLIVQRIPTVRVPSPELPGPDVRSQRPTVPHTSSLTDTVWYYLLAMVLPIFSFGSCVNWRYNPSLVVHTAELFITSLSRVCTQAHARFEQLAQDRVARELFATAMDIMLVVYAIGFLVLSMYQASVSI